MLLRVDARQSIVSRQGPPEAYVFLNQVVEFVVFDTDSVALVILEWRMWTDSDIDWVTIGHLRRRFIFFNEVQRILTTRVSRTMWVNFFAIAVYVVAAARRD